MNAKFEKPLIARLPVEARESIKRGGTIQPKKGGKYNRASSKANLRKELGREER